MLNEKKSREKYIANVKRQLDELHDRVRHRRERRKDKVEERFDRILQKMDMDGSMTE